MYIEIQFSNIYIAKICHFKFFLELSDKFLDVLSVISCNK